MTFSATLTVLSGRCVCLGIKYTLPFVAHVTPNNTQQSCCTPRGQHHLESTREQHQPPGTSPFHCSDNSCIISKPECHVHNDDNDTHTNTWSQTPSQLVWSCHRACCTIAIICAAPTVGHGAQAAGASSPCRLVPQPCHSLGGASSSNSSTSNWRRGSRSWGRC